MKLLDPPLAEVIRADIRSVEHAADSLLSFYESVTGRFNYLRGTKAVKTSYRGCHNITALLSVLPSEEKRVGFRPNQEIISRAAPLAFERKT